MPTLSLPTDFLGSLILRIRGVEAQAGEVDVDAGSNPIDDNMVDAVQASEGDLSERELRQQIRSLNDRQQAELVALLWIGRGEEAAEEWESVVEMARERRDVATADYLLGEPLLAEYLSEGLERLEIALPDDVA